MIVAVNIDKIPVMKNGEINVTAISPAIKASKRQAEIVFHTKSLVNLMNRELIIQLLNIIPGKASLFIGHPSAEIYLGD